MKLVEDLTTCVEVPLTEAQREIALNCIMGEDNSRGYHVSVALELLGNLNLEALSEATQEVLSRHEALRIVAIDTRQMCQYVAGSLEVTLPVVDLTKEQNPAEAVLSHRAEEAGRSFDFTAGPFIRFRILRESEHRVTLMVTGHHIVVDGVAIGIILSELGKIYSAKAAGVVFPLKEPESWIDYTRLGTKTLAFDVATDSLWKGFADSQYGPISLPSDSLGIVSADTTAARVDITMSGEELQALRSFASESGVTLYTLLLGTYSQFVCRWCGVEQGLIGMQVSARPSEFSDLVGHDTNLLPFPARRISDRPIESYLQEVQGLVYDLYDRRSISFGAIAREFPVLRGGAQQGLKCLFNLDPVAEQPMFEGLSCIQSPENHGSTNFDLDLNIMLSPTHALWSLTFSRGRMDEKRARQFLQYLIDYSIRVSASKAIPLSAIGLAPLEARDQLWQNCVKGPSLDVQFNAPYESFMQRAKEYPDAVAVSSEKETVTFQALEELVARYACGLRMRGVQEGMVVALCLPRSIDAVALVLACFRLGAVFIPIDSELPLGRRQSIVLDAEPKIVVLGDGVSSMSGSSDEVSTQELQAAPLDREIVGISSENPAYIIYTSGTTGRPKGVVVTQGALFNVLHSYRDMYKLEPLTVHMQSASFSFDVFIGDILRSVCLGGRLFICPSETRLDSRELSRVILDQGIQFAEFVPAVFRKLCKYAEEYRIEFPSLKTAVISSDSWAVPEYRRFRATFPTTRILNAFGITEVTIDSTWYDDTLFDLPDDGMVPIGEPFYNTSLLLLDEAFSPLPIGVPGELFIGGAGVAAGYYRNPELTAARFTELSHGGVSERLYRTGDLGRLLPNGHIQLLGRAVYHVKVRGVRIELEEVDEVIRSVAEIDDALTVVEDGQRLVAYVVTQSDELTVSILRHFLSDRLSPASIPSEFRLVASIPLNSNGKRDRILVKSQPSRPLSAGTHVPEPKGEVERRMLELWRQVLSSPSLTVEDHFFDAGGHSLTAVELCRAIERDFGIQLPIMKIIECGTVRKLSEQLTSTGKTGQSLPLKRGAIHGQALVFIHGLVLYAEIVQHVDGPSVYAIWREKIEGVRPETLPVDRVVQEYLPDLLAIPEQDVTVCGFSDSGFLAFELARALRRMGRASRVVLLDSWVPGIAPDETDTSSTWAQFQPDSLDAPIHLFRALTSESDEPSAYLDRGWTPHADGGLMYHDFECDHFSLLRGDHAIQVARELSILF